MNCSLCSNSQLSLFYDSSLHRFFSCDGCAALIRDPATYLDKKQELERYLTHNNDVEDTGYQNFVQPVVNQVLEHFMADRHLGLDYGAGPGPVITKLLNDKGYKLNLYDPFFWPDTAVLKKSYDYIVCCEVMEHFNNPKEEFAKLFKLLKPGGQLICKTDLYNSDINFEKWYYKNDPTHVIIYQIATLDWICQNFGWNKVAVNERTIVFYK